MIKKKYSFNPQIGNEIIENAYCLGIEFVLLSIGRGFPKQDYYLKFKSDMERQKFNHLVRLFLRKFNQ